MDATAAAKRLKINRFLPYWAVFQADLKQTLRSWIYRVWVLVSLGAAVGWLLYRFGARQVGGFVQPAPEMMGDLLSWVALGSVTLIIVLTAGAICSERGTVADSVLSRGISRFQYFLGKWHARLVVVLGTFLAIALLAFVGSFLMLHTESLSFSGCLVALATVAALLVMVVTCGVSVSALSNNTVVSIAVVWMALYGVGFVLSLLPETIPSPDRTLQALPNVLKGFYDWQMLSRLISGSLSMSLLVGLVGMIGFSRKDV
ncbi:MAG: ABC transporter permease [Gemmataceae bacterium]|nr:ABC transporter permease [Gemmataceae bacterium]